MKALKIKTVLFGIDDFSDDFNEEVKNSETPSIKKEGDDDTITLKKSDLVSLIQDEVKKATKNTGDSGLLEALAKRLGDNQAPLLDRSVRGIIPIEDMEETPTTFFVMSNVKNIFDDYKNGASIQAPYNIPIKFKTWSSTKPNGRDGSRQIVSIFMTYSKSQKKFLREHTTFMLTMFEETFSRYKRIIGNKFKAKVFKGQENEARLSLFILNKMKEIGMPKTIRVA